MFVIGLNHVGDKLQKRLDMCEKRFLSNKNVKQGDTEGIDVDLVVCDSCLLTFSTYLLLLLSVRDLIIFERQLIDGVYPLICVHTQAS